uniref:HepT-like ribonuclease domain-containing protein n=1 Tax=Alcaligenes faecalis TaxID=511 RepID=UPI003D00F2B5
MSKYRLPDYLEHMQQAATDACGMRNRIAHGYFDVNLDVVWDTVQTALPELLQQLLAVRQDADGDTPC